MLLTNFTLCLAGDKPAETCSWWWQSLQLAFVGDKPYTTTCLWWWQALHWDLKMVATNLTLRLAHGVITLTPRLAHGGDKPYTETCSWRWQTLLWDLLMVVTNLTPRQTLHWDLLMVVTNLTLTLAHGGDKLLRMVTKLTPRHAHGGDKPYTETYSWW